MFTLCKGYSDDEEEESNTINVVSEKTKSLEEKIAYYKMKGHVERGYITIYTNLGDFEVELYWYHSPKTCLNFYTLCEMGFYDNTIFHRVIPNFVIQGGDPTGTGKGGKSIYGEYFEDEINKELKHTGAGILSMSNNGPNTNSSQFFITLAPLPHLDGKHTIFARVSKNMACIENIASVQTTATNKPIFDLKILRTSTAVNAD
ncbi:peptidyl-prolyl cis-trans isomerase, putative [Plasmodium chabaudi chabaudi]|uniref:Peptidyl-prolyl cis-trans isomerase n=2 Tax=Plasmodium chabaudi TaxID=5825 RepID=A0A077TQ36_PLACU|nr:peptidyl-prolyl cis-trans isomerase, putative [Plasmodium chabaudi chabaudi]SCM23463.1 peptidyl-prolyl cis-trans isomerase, putative [Plasmodium chabaudi adami]SCM25535.1 peptidyl-prolyl cis-trans isomerase, putative [Plasmodium chabaudi chabaudi]SCN62516.1 peptidyl-prolyl cis-trans isomerase, putative [Plasmodium chabaudi adami]SCN62519.1 peptidyl-prolyl cis-trans isomerase, putative [Plasmodium chabaudi chabaudi]VTZ69908.1 peptidyl-prolyl cis-trans isomerase, putative [Plasmodium chabaudi|eukprot:XP_744178.1 peptidyl-prolyl cis-trans isomerase, putative [Plasmodium chabaudi chabaudi]